MRRIFTTQPPPRKMRWLIAMALAGGLAVLAWHAVRHGTATGQHQGPWVYGPAAARFTVVEYADLECPYCKAHFAVMRQWIDQAAEQNTSRSAGQQIDFSVNWQWQHLPLPGHEPAAGQSALLAECVGAVHGNDAFWKSVEWLYQHTRGNGLGLPEGTPVPDLSSLRGCLQDKSVMQRIQQQVSQAQHAGITGTPTLVIKDNRTGKTMRVLGPASGDVLLSAMDMLVGTQPDASPATGPATTPSNMPVDKSVNDMPR